MQMKVYKRRKKLCRVLRKGAAVIIRFGMICAVWMGLSIVAGMAPDRYAGWVLVGLGTMTVGYVIGRTARYLEKRGMFFRKITKKSACKRQQP